MNYQKLTAGKSKEELTTIHSNWHARLQSMEIPERWRNKSHMAKQKRVILISTELMRRCRNVAKFI